MARLIKRIPFDSLEIVDLSGSSSADPSDPDNPGRPKDFPLLIPSFSFTNTTPVRGEVEFSFPAEDYPRVRAWFTGDFSHVTAPESPTLKKNMASAVLGALKKFSDSALSRNLFNAPFRIGWRYRLFDGTTVTPQPPLLLNPGSDAPMPIVTDYSVYEKMLHTDILFSRSPWGLSFNVSPPVNGDAFIGIITAIEFFITPPERLHSQDAEVAGMRSVNIGGTRERIWKYDPYEPEAIEAAARTSSAFHVVASLPYEGVIRGDYTGDSPFPLEAGILARLTDMPKAAHASMGSNSGLSDPSSSQIAGETIISGWRPYLHISTPPLDLGEPEARKSVTDLFLRGVFERDVPELTLFGSLHRHDWRMLAKAKGPYIRGLRRTPCRWLRVEIRLPMRRDDFIDALTFRFFREPIRHL